MFWRFGQPCAEVWHNVVTLGVHIAPGFDAQVQVDVGFSCTGASIAGALAFCVVPFTASCSQHLVHHTQCRCGIYLVVRYLEKNEIVIRPQLLSPHLWPNKISDGSRFAHPVCCRFLVNWQIPSLSCTSLPVEAAAFTLLFSTSCFSCFGRAGPLNEAGCLPDS